MNEVSERSPESLGPGMVEGESLDLYSRIGVRTTEESMSYRRS